MTPSKCSVVCSIVFADSEKRDSHCCQGDGNGMVSKGSGDGMALWGGDLGAGLGRKIELFRTK